MAGSAAAASSAAAMTGCFPSAVSSNLREFKESWALLSFASLCSSGIILLADTAHLLVRWRAGGSQMEASKKGSARAPRAAANASNSKNAGLTLAGRSRSTNEGGTFRASVLLLHRCCRRQKKVARLKLARTLSAAKCQCHGIIIAL